MSRAADTPPGNLPAPLTRLLGRDAALAELIPALWDTRLLVLCGPGGIGKSRLALALAESVRGDLIGGAWWADLSSTEDPDLVARGVADALLPGAAASDPVATLAQELTQPALVVLDNAEQVSEACAALATELLARLPGLRLLVTSRQSLGLAGERVWRVSGLPVETVDAVQRAAQDGDAGAVALFAQRAREASSGFDPDSSQTRRTVQEICRWLDGNPLAIELAAARVPVLSVAEIAARLRSDVGFLRHARRASPERQRALTDTLEWSYRLLDDDERRLFARLGAFRGGFSLPAAEAVCSDGLIEPGAVLDLIGQLVDRSLVHVVEAPGAPRFRLAPTVRQFALSKLEDTGQVEAIRERHADWFTALAERGHPQPGTPADQRWFETIALDHDNLRAARGWLDERAPERAARLACALWPFQRRGGHYDEASAWLEAALAHEAQLPDPGALDALIDLGEACLLRCDYSVATAHLERALDRLGSDRESRAAARVLQRLGSIARECGDYAQARRLHADSRTIWERLGDAHGVAASESYLSFAAWLAGDFAEADELGTRALASFRGAGHLADAALTLINLGAAAGYRGDRDAAVAALQEALGISRRLGFQEGIAWALHELAIVCRGRRGSARESELMLRDALLIHHRLGDRWRTASVLEEIAGGALIQSDERLAAMLLGAADGLRHRIDAPIPPVEAGDRDRARRRLRRALGTAGFHTAFAEGRAADLDAVVARAGEALGQLGSGSPNGAASQIAPVLTAREMGVLELLGAGATNREIGEELYISASTAGVHVSNILRKLGARRRVDAVARAQALGLLATPADSIV